MNYDAPPSRLSGCRRIASALLVLLSALSLVYSIARAQSSTVDLVCAWDSYPTNEESFVIELAKRRAYWPNEQRELKIIEMNQGIVVLEGTKRKVRAAQDRSVDNVSLRFTINRVSGELRVEWLSPPFPVESLGNNAGSIYTRGCQKKRLF
jgi:hypothetical protein